MTLEQLRKALKEKSEALAPLKDKVAADGATADDVKALNDAVTEIKAINDRIDALVAADKAAASAAAPVETKTDDPENAGKPAKRAPAQIRKDEGALFPFGVLGIALCAVKKGRYENIGKALEHAGFSQVADDFIAAGGQKSLIASGNPGGILVPPTMAADIIEFLRPSTAFLKNMPRRVPMPNGSYFQSGGNTGASAAYGPEGAAPAYSEATFRDLNLSAKELKGKTAISNMLLDFGLPGIRQFVEQDLRDAMAEAMDLNLFAGDGAQSRPLGIYNIPGIGTGAAQVDTTSPTLAQTDAEARRSINYLATRNVPLGSARWTMSYQTAGYLEDLRDGNGNYAYPTMQGPSKTWKSFPVAVTTNLPTNLGGNGNGAYLSLGAWNHVFFGEAPGIEFRVSDEAAYTDSGGNLRSAAERNETVMFTFMRHDVGLRHLAALWVSTNVRWGN